MSLKQALAQLGFKGGTRSATEWNQWAQSEKQVLAEIMQEHGIEWEQLGTHEEHLSVLDYKKQERAKEVRALDTTIAEKQTQVDEIEQTLQSVQKQVIDIDKIENISVKKALLSDKVTLPRNDFDNLLNAAKQYVVYRRQDDRLQGLLDAANDKIKQLEGVIGELKQKVSKLVSKLSNIEFWHAAFAACDIRHKIYMYMGCCLVHVQMAPKHTERWVTRLKSVRILNQTLFSRFCQLRMDACIVLISNL